MGNLADDGVVVFAQSGFEEQLGINGVVIVHSFYI